jgi:hypothetical protein
MLLKKK